MAKREKPTLKELDDLHADIRSLNSLLLEMQDHSNSMADERDKYKNVLKKLLKMVLDAEDPRKIKDFANTEMKRLVS